MGSKIKTQITLWLFQFYKEYHPPAPSAGDQSIISAEYCLNEELSITCSDGRVVRIVSAKYGIMGISRFDFNIPSIS